MAHWKVDKDLINKKRLKNLKKLTMCSALNPFTYIFYMILVLLSLKFFKQDQYIVILNNNFWDPESNDEWVSTFLLVSFAFSFTLFILFVLFYYDMIFFVLFSILCCIMYIYYLYHIVSYFIPCDAWSLYNEKKGFGLDWGELMSN